jgi:ACS family tartrate transporter-like MFS transporter
MTTPPPDPRTGSATPDVPDPLERARRKAYRRLLPLLFLCYIIAYVDRNNVAIAFATMSDDLNAPYFAAHPRADAEGKPLPGPFNNDVLGTGFGIFFLGYFLLEIPGTLLVEKWSARKWISRIMISWGIMAAATALVKTPWQFYSARFLLGLAEAGFFPGVIVYLTHWFPSRDRAKALSWFLIGTPIAQFASPLLSYPLLKIGTTETVGDRTVVYPEILGLEGWQWVYIAWGIPAVILGLVVLFLLTDRPRHARWLTPDEREALENELQSERASLGGSRHMTWGQALRQPKVLLLAAAYFFIVTGNYGVESFLPTILQAWYKLSKDDLQVILLFPALGSLIGQLFIGWSSDRTKERRLHTALPIYLGATALACATLGRHPLPLMVVLFAIAATGLKAYLPAFWSLPSLFLTAEAAAGSIGLINSVGNLGGYVGPKVLGWVETKTGSFVPGILFLCVSMAVSATIIMSLRLGHRDHKPDAGPSPRPLPDAARGPAAPTLRR